MESTNSENSNSSISSDLLGFQMNTLFAKKLCPKRRNATHNKLRPKTVGVEGIGSSSVNKHKAGVQRSKRKDKEGDSNVFGYDETDFFESLQHDFESNIKEDTGDKSRRINSETIPKDDLDVGDDEGGFLQPEEDLDGTGRSRQVITDLRQLAEESEDVQKLAPEEDRFSALNQDLSKSSRSFRHKQNSIAKPLRNREDTVRTDIKASEKTKADEGSFEFNPGVIHSLYQKDIDKLHEKSHSNVTVEEVNSIQELFDKLCMAKISTEDDHVIIRSEERPSGVQILKEDLLDGVKDL